MTRLFPHQANRRFLIPSRYKGSFLNSPPEGGILDPDLAVFGAPCNASQFVGWLCQGSAAIDTAAPLGQRASFNTTGNQHLHDPPDPVVDITGLWYCHSIGPEALAATGAWNPSFFGIALNSVPPQQGGVGLFTGFGTPTGQEARFVGTGSTNGATIVLGLWQYYEGDRRAEFENLYGARDLTPAAAALDFDQLVAWLLSEGWLDAVAHAHHLTVNGGQILDRVQGDACLTNHLTPAALEVDMIQGLQQQGRCQP